MKYSSTHDAEASLSERATPTRRGGVENRSVLRACNVLRCFSEKRGSLGLAAVAFETHLSKATAYRLLTTLVAGGMLESPAKNTYTLAGPAKRRPLFRIGYASQTEEFAFSRLVSESIRSSAYAAGVELLVLNNRYSPTVAIRNAETFVREHVDLVIEFQTSQESATTVASRLVDAAIPIIAIEVPHPGAMFYGANNHRAGVIAGRALAKACVARWQGHFDELILLDLPVAGPLVGSRLTGIVAGLREALPDIPDDKVRFLNGNGRFENSLQTVRKHLRRRPIQRALLGAMNDPSCLGALRAFEEAGHEHDCLAVSHNGTLEARREIRRPGSALIGSVAYFPERYGEAILMLALDKLNGRQVPQTTFVKHQLITAQNVNDFYPNDALLDREGGDSLLYSQR